MKENNIVRFDGYVKKADRNKAYGHKSGVVWFTGLSASGKSTIAHTLEKILFEKGIKVYVFDGDNIRHGLNSDLGFSPEDRRENLRRIAEVSKLFVDAGLIVLACFISPYKKDREYIKQIIGKEDFIEIYVKCPVEVCEKRDPKGFYKKAKAGIIKGYTGIDAPYEEPENPDLIIESDKLSPEESANKVYEFLVKKGWLQTF
ncbi:MAG: Adenylylsulfate kinase or related kinase [Thermodesulfobacterium sp.]|uniref:Adenylyl-sulfate kinase n=1 Tax=Candidatus Thermodesulfobacterium syntrophicum TaxID=3060442 RepID=A0AAE3P3M8_9BACT|nr:Adenylylsulfate kinase or related kinase [Candidatus Thermodesulfobacterium syntrophicum]